MVWGTIKILLMPQCFMSLAAKKGMKEAQFNIAQILHYGPR